MGNQLTFHRVGNDSPCAGVTNDAGIYVEGYQYQYTVIAEQAITDMINALEPLINVDNQVTGYGVIPGKVEPLGIDYNAPTGQPEWDFSYSDNFNPSLPAVVSLNEAHNVTDPGNAPINDQDINTDFDPIAPLDATPPGDAPYVEDVVIPDPPPSTDLQAPDLHPILIKPINPVDIPDFTALLPDMSGIVPPTGDFSWSEIDYDSAILQSVQSRISELLAGGVGIPDFVWNAIWDRGRDKTIRDADRVISETTDEAASKGWSIPTGAQLGRISEARRAGNEQISEQARELVIQQAQHEIENLKYAIAQGKALEEMIGGWYQAKMSRALDAAKYSYQLEVEIFNAQVSLFNAEISLFNAEVLQYKTLVEAELSKLEEQKLYLEGQKLIGELNMQEVAIYEANIKAYGAEIDAYNATVKGILGKAENNKIRMEGYGIEVQAYGELVRAKTSEYEGLKASISAEQMKISIFETQIKAYQTEVAAYSTKVDAAYKPMDMRQLNNDNSFKTFSSSLQVQEAKSKDKMIAVESAAKEFDARLQSFNVNIENEKNRVATKLKETDASVNVAGQTTQANIASAGNYTNAAIASVELLNTTSEVLARAFSQIAASAMGVVNVSAGISDSSSNKSGCSTTYSGEAGAAN